MDSPNVKFTKMSTTSFYNEFFRYNPYFASLEVLLYKIPFWWLFRVNKTYVEKIQFSIIYDTKLITKYF